MNYELMDGNQCQAWLEAYYLYVTTKPSYGQMVLNKFVQQNRKANRYLNFEPYITVNCNKLETL